MKSQKIPESSQPIGITLKGSRHDSWLNRDGGWFTRAKGILPHLLVLLITLFWGLNAIAMKIAYREIDAWMFGGLRLGVTLPFVLLSARFLPGYVPFIFRDVLKIAAFSLVGFTGFQLLFPFGIYETSAPIGGMLMATMPVWVVLINLVSRTDKVTMKSVLGVLATLVGIAIIMFSSSGSTSGGSLTSARGVLLLIGAELFFAINTIFLRPFMRKYSVAQVTSIGLVISGILFAGVLNRRIVTFDYRSLSLLTWGMIFYSGIIGLFLANLLWNHSVRLIGSTRIAVYANLPAVFIMIFGALLLGEVLVGIEIFAAVIIAAGVVLVQLRGSVTGRRRTFEKR